MARPQITDGMYNVMMEIIEVEEVFSGSFPCITDTKGGGSQSLVSKWKDEAGNYWFVIGDHPTILFSNLEQLLDIWKFFEERSCSYEYLERID